MLFRSGGIGVLGVMNQLTVDTELWAVVWHQGLGAHIAPPAAVHRIEGQQMGRRRRIAARIVDMHQLEAPGLSGAMSGGVPQGAKDEAADATKTVDADLHGRRCRPGQEPLDHTSTEIDGYSALGHMPSAWPLALPFGLSIALPIATPIAMPIALPIAAVHGSAALEVASEPLDHEQAQLLLRALADPIRLRVIEALGQGERCVCDLSSELGLAQSKLSFHLRVLRDAGLIAARQQGRWVYYRLQPSAMSRLRDWLDQVVAG